MVNNGMDTKTDSLRYAKRLGIPMTLKAEKRFIHALMIIGTYKTYPLNLWHSELILSLRYTDNTIDYWMDGTELTLYYTL